MSCQSLATLDPATIACRRGDSTMCKGLRPLVFVIYQALTKWLFYGIIKRFPRMGEPRGSHPETGRQKVINT